MKCGCCLIKLEKRCGICMKPFHIKQEIVCVEDMYIEPYPEFLHYHKKCIDKATVKR